MERARLGSRSAWALRVVFGQVDRRDDLAAVVDQPAGLVEEHDLERLDALGQRVGRLFGVDVQDLSAGGGADARQNGQVAGAQRGVDGIEVHLDHAAAEAVAAVARLGAEHDRPDGARPGPELLQSLAEAKIFALQHAAGEIERGRIERTMEPGLGQRFVDLRLGAVDHDGVEPHLRQEGQRRDQAVELALEHAAVDHHDRELFLAQRRELLEVLLDLGACAEAAQEARDDLLGGRAHAAPSSDLVSDTMVR